MSQPQRLALKIALLYLVLGVAWILFSDRALLLAVTDARRLSLLQTYKGWAYVAVTAGLLYLLVLRSAAELERAQAQALHEQKMQALGRMAAGIVHDFRNHLFVIKTSAELLRLDNPAGAAALESVGTINQACQRAEALVRQLLAFATDQPAPLLDLDLEPFLLRLEPLLRNRLKPGQRLALRLESGLSILAEPLQLEQALLNLVANAADAVDPESRLPLVELELRRRGDLAVLSVQDHGSGMPPEVRARAFEPFFSTKPAGQGAGLGLAAVYATAQRSRGSASLQSQPGQGTRVELSFPLL